MHGSAPSRTTGRTRTTHSRLVASLAGAALVGGLTPLLATAPAVAAPGDVLLQENFDEVADGSLPAGWLAADGTWEVVDGELIGTSTGSGQNARLTFGEHANNYRVEATVRFESVVNAARWAGVILDIGADGTVPWSHAVLRSGSTAPNGTEFAVRTGGNTWNVLTATPAPADAGVGNDVRIAVEVQGGQARWFWEGTQLARTTVLPRSGDGVLGLIANGSTVAFDDVVVTELEPASLLRDDSEPAYAVAHRGYSTMAPENTSFAIAAAIHSGSRGIELDVQRTADGAHVLWHDDTIDAKSDGTGRIADHTLEELRQLDVGSWFDPVFSGARITTWEEALDQLAGTGLLISLEIKSGSVPETLQAVIDRGMTDQVVFTNFSTDLIAQAQAFAPEIRRGLIISEAAADPMPAVEQYGLSAYIAGANSIIANPSIVPLLREAGVAVQAWTINDANRWQQLTEIGIDGMLTDRAAEYVGYTERVQQDAAQPAQVSIVSPGDGARLDRADSLAIGVNAVNATNLTGSLDGRGVDLGAPVALLGLALGEHVVEVSADGVEPVSRTFELEASQAGLRALVDAADGLSRGQRTTLHSLVTAELWRAVAGAADAYARAGTEPELMRLVAGDARALL
ncbi:glycerophosphoryl diester phosphodiesterase [Beutenbergia cavernae DSM 12333]|uniref:Glycerophosphoryl diester phosphodiesterase n=1 Tax=Beutenbergia cavernae (strain ATCC BAA-8 / DSM 12333 / CCUG 43141 / JCM 11478 / NBRC 16432 / NCIMB 13614 / HKI 0122) TaxID=471853 RepID=C5C3X9_BEUC1|nr:glycerophosphodiester phosphodiesterase family protein [Beutenbergia cavernae]ACQ79892.1 glycerophosphoryl diester phosphodiesterase [Beutenbergia cavernae DSM 12333]